MRKVGFILSAVIVLSLLISAPIHVFAEDFGSSALPADIEAEVKQLYAESRLTDISSPSPDYIHITYYGEYDGVHAMEIEDGYHVYEADSLRVVVHGHEFVFDPPIEMYLYYKGEMKQLTEAWEAGWLTHESLCNLWNYYTNGIYEAPKTGDAVLVTTSMLLISGACLAALAVSRTHTIYRKKE